MIHKAGSVRDPFTFSLGGMATIASVVAPPIIADDRINRIRDSRAEKDGESEPDLPSFSAGRFAPCCA